MTLGDFFTLIGQNPILLIGYYAVVPLTALLAGILGQAEGHLTPWKYLYGSLVYLAAVPGMFALILTLYFWLFERRSILETDLYIQVLPILSMVLTFWLIRWNTPLDKVPGFGKIAGLLIMVFVVLILMWAIDRTHIIAFTYLPFYIVILILIFLLILFRYGWFAMFERPK
ncbi:MAG: hypothetical protein KA479_02995 [Saprospiraceae bacterium]|nr:hypothetical protein [Saprospiraceae bacterium]